MKMKKGAIFGLDARIALAIFGALSVISGAALYSAIQQAKNEGYKQSLNEFIKAVEHYYLDTGEISVDSGFNTTNIGNLYQNYAGSPFWKGPYLGYGSTAKNKISTRVLGDSSVDDGWMFVMAPLDGWSADYTELVPPLCSTSDCHYWVNLYDESEKVLSFYNSLNSDVDGDSAYNTGKVRLRYPNSNKYSFYYYAFPVQ